MFSTYTRRHFSDRIWKSKSDIVLILISQRCVDAVEIDKINYINLFQYEVIDLFSGVASVDNWRDEYSYIVFCLFNFFWNLLFLWSLNTNIWIFAPPIIDAGYATVFSVLENMTKSYFS